MLLPGAIAAAVLGLLAYSAKSVLLPTVGVWTVPVVPKPYAINTGAPASPGGLAEGPGPMLAQAPGWIEPDPYAISVPALAEGVLREVLVLEGQRVEAGQVVARMVDDDARLALRAAEAQLAALQAEVGKAEADVRVAEMRAAEAGDQLERARTLAPSGAVAAGDLARQGFRFQAAQQEIESARAAIGVARANVGRQEVACDEARLRLARMEIVSPVSGTVLARSVEPGTRISMSGAGTGAAHVLLRVYDPHRLQVRVDVPQADSARIGPGVIAEVVSEALPDKVFSGKVTRIVHEANIQRNTVQVKVSIDEPPEALKPEMQVRVRFYAPRSPAASGANALDTPQTSNSEGASHRLLVPESTLLGLSGDKAQVWVVEHDDGGALVAARRDVHVAGRGSDGHIDIASGLRAGDRIIVDPPMELRTGTRIRLLGEKTTDQEHQP